MTHRQSATRALDSIGSAAELEQRWQDQRAQRQRASELFHGPIGLDELDDEDED